MNINLRIGLVGLFTFYSLLLFSQEGCKVLKPGISINYEGKCKNGLAHGKGVASGTDRYEGQFSKGLPNGYGTYTWAGGNVYDGEWTGGLRNGIGKYTISIKTGDSIQDGLWQNDEYKGPKPRSPFVCYKEGIDRYSIRKNITPRNRVLIDIYQNGIRNKSIINFTITSTSGSETKLGESVGYDNITFPVKIQIGYLSSNKVKQVYSNVKFEFEIYEPGDWTVELNN